VLDVVLVLVGWLVGLIVFGLLVEGCKALARRVRSRRSRRRRRQASQRRAAERREADESSSEPDPPPEPSFAHVLLVEVDAAAGSLAPAVDLTTNVPLARGRLRLELIDDAGVVRAHGEHRLARQGALTRARFESFSIPAGATLTDVLRWRWDVVLLDATGERARWQERLNPAGRIDEEAELVVTVADPRPEPAPESREARLGYTTEDLIRILREAGLDDRSRRQRLPTSSE